ncbi:hypothetical protein GOBAR_DD02491 [Gossypium barbadense]|nr:hypothetical protein GOBAR_DD02491 [Gossypium barbadense]
MIASLIRFDDKHISVAQAIMVDDRVLEGFIHNIGKPTIFEICGDLQQVKPWVELRGTAREAKRFKVAIRPMLGR